MFFLELIEFVELCFYFACNIVQVLVQLYEFSMLILFYYVILLKLLGKNFETCGLLDEINLYGEDVTVP